MPGPARTVAVLTAALALAALAPTQDDLRDRLLLANGRTVNGRVTNPFAKDELLVLQGGKRVRVATADIAERELLADHITQFFVQRHRFRDTPRALRYLVDWARQHQLPGLAQLQALELVLQDDTDEAMHLAAGHRRRGSHWQWPHGDSWLTEAQLHNEMLAHPLRLRGERFTLSCDAGLLENVRALFDLEYLAVVWFERFGQDLQLEEVLDPIDVRTYRNAHEFPKWGFRPRPYFVPPPHANVGRTFFAGPTPNRPEQLFFVGAQGLLYRTMIGEVNRQDSRDRTCSWLEIGLGCYLEALMQGDAGFAKPVARNEQRLGLKALTAMARGYRLTHLVHLPMYASYYLTDDTATATNWAAAQMFVTWLLDENKQPKTRPAFLRYVVAALREGKGDSSSAFDDILGRRIEEFDEPWRAWLLVVSRN